MSSKPSLSHLSHYIINPEAPVLGKGNHGIVFHVSDGDHEFALKIECEVERRSPTTEVDMRALEVKSADEFRRLRKKHILNHVVEIYKIWPVERSEFYEWAGTVAGDNPKYLEFIDFAEKTCKGALLAVLMQKIDSDLAEVIPTPRILFDLYYCFMSMISHGIVPQDLHPGNIGLVEEDPTTYRICDLQAEFGGAGEDSIGVKLIDYTFYNFGEKKPKYPLDVTHQRIMAFMQQVIVLANVKDDDDTLEMWNYLTTEDGRISALVVLYWMLKSYFPSKIVRRGRGSGTYLRVDTSKALCELLERVTTARP